MQNVSSAEIIKKINESRGLPCERREDTAIPLVVAASEGDYELCVALLASGADPNEQTTVGWTALLMACALDKRISCPHLDPINTEAWITFLRDTVEGERAPCKLAKSKANIVRVLLDRHADVNHQADGGQTALILAAMASDKLLAQQLVKAGAVFGRYLLEILPGFTACSVAQMLFPGSEVSEYLREAAQSSFNWPQEQESLKALSWSRLLDQLNHVHNKASDEGTLETSQEALGVLLQTANLPAIASDAVQHGTNPLLALHSFLVGNIPCAMLRLWDDWHEIPEDDLMTIVSVCPGSPLRKLPTLDKYVANHAVYQQMIVVPSRTAFAFAIPNAAALNCISRYSPVVEMGAGTGYWSYYLSMEGCDVVAYDLQPPIEANVNKFLFREVFTNVSLGGPDVLEGHRDRTLLLVWPYSYMRLDSPWDADCLEHYSGDFVIYVGEWEGQTLNQCHSPGWTSSAPFQRKLYEEFECIERIEIPRWPRLMDDLTVWKRRCRDDSL